MVAAAKKHDKSDPAQENDHEKKLPRIKKNKYPIPFMQNRELSWLDFNARVLDQGADESVPLLQRLNFISIFWSNLQEFFMVRVGSLTDLSLIKKDIIDSKTGMTPSEQLSAVYDRVRELYPIQEQVYQDVRSKLAERGVVHADINALTPEQEEFLDAYMHLNVMPFLSPQIINSRHPFPHLENGALYVLVRLMELPVEEPELGKKSHGKDKKKSKNGAAEGVMVGLIPMPRQCDRVIKIPGTGFTYVLLEQVVEKLAPEVFSMYKVKHTNVICITRNADLDPNEGIDESDEDYREHMKRILKRRGRLAPVRLESERPLSENMRELMCERLGLKPSQLYYTSVPLDLSYTWGLEGRVSEKTAAELTYTPFTPQWPASLDRTRTITEQVREHDVLLSYPYESMDPFVQLLREAAVDPQVTSIKITLYRLASQSHLAEALIAAAENGKEVTALCELRARFDENNNIEWSQRFEEAGCNVIYGFRDYKVHSKICCIARQTPEGPEYITQLGTGNYNEKTAKLYTDLSYITCNPIIGRDAVDFFRNMALENASDSYGVLSVAPIQIKPAIMARIDQQIELARAGEPCGLFFKTNSVTDKDLILKITEASQAGVPTIMFVRGISCILPGVKGYTDNVRVVSIVGRLLEHSRIYGFGPWDEMALYLSSADIMTRNMDKRVEIAWPILGEDIRSQIMDYLNVCMKDTAKLRELQSDGKYTPLRSAVPKGEEAFDSQEFLIHQAQERFMAQAQAEAERTMSSYDRALAATKAAREEAGVDIDEDTNVVDVAAVEAEALAEELDAVQAAEEAVAVHVVDSEEVAPEAEAAAVEEVIEEPQEPSEAQADAEEKASDDAVVNDKVNESEAVESEVVEGGPRVTPLVARNLNALSKTAGEAAAVAGSALGHAAGTAGRAIGRAAGKAASKAAGMAADAASSGARRLISLLKQRVRK